VLRIRLEGPEVGLTGTPVDMTYRLVDPEGTLLEELLGARVTLTLDGSAVFGSTLAQGLLLEGGGTNRVLVEFVDGLVRIEVSNAVEEMVSPGAEDTEPIGVEWVGNVSESFETNDGGFTSSGEPDGWEWGVPTSGPDTAASGERVWATNLTGPYPVAELVPPYDPIDLILTTPDYFLPASSQPELEFQSWYSFEPCCDFGYCELSTDSGGTWEVLESYQSPIEGPGASYTVESFDLTPYAGSTVRVRFRLSSDISISDSGWYLDEFALRGIGRTIVFLQPQADADTDGLTNVEELTIGTDPRDSDTDDDSWEDGVDNCPLVENPDQADTDDDGVGDACS
jgi:bacillopeptidase F (M6 metalloprotease family)